MFRFKKWQALYRNPTRQLVVTPSFDWPFFLVLDKLMNREVRLEVNKIRMILKEDDDLNRKSNITIQDS